MTQGGSGGWWLDLVSGRTRGPGAAVARVALALLSGPYRLGIGVRSGLYRLGLLRSTRLSVPVVCVGNLSLGGTGKTPMVARVAEHLLSRGHRVAVLSRGYGRTAAGGDDEGLLPAAPTDRLRRYVGASRVASGRRALAEFGATCLLLDDGFQHFALARDLDIVLLDATAAPRHDRLFPAGTLREPPTALARAGVVVLTRSDQVAPEDLARLRAEVAADTGRAPAEAVHVPAAVRAWSGGEVRGLDAVRGRRGFAFCGIGNPEAFRRTLASIGATPVGFRGFPDHHPYTAADRAAIVAAARAVGAELLITTAKDALRLDAAWRGETLPIEVLEIRLDVVRNGESLWAAVDAACPAPTGDIA